MPNPYPKEFLNNVIRVALTGEKGSRIVQIAEDNGIHEGVLTKWIHQAENYAGNKPAQTAGESTGLRELWTLNQLLE
ncbi:transposase [Brevibacterium casei]|uniref:transposase n=1 Tax=Brevibacterium casei TaxID=33889 RepID=UPI00223A98B4|nr:transposase [Brevibacterium casei]MCT1447320.1 transposase [Brevibacterium casei]